MTKESHELLRVSGICQNSPEEQQIQLRDFVQSNNAAGIYNLVSEDPDILEFIYGHPYFKPILYIAIDDLADQVLPTTVQTLIDLGANVYYSDKETHYKEAIHFAVLGANPSILDVIVKNIKEKERINATTNGNTALNLLVRERAASKNFEKCLEILLKSGIDVNKADNKNFTPIVWAAHKGYKTAVSAIIKCGRYVDIDTHRYRNKSARMLIEEKQLYDDDLPAEIFDSNENKVNLAIKFIQEKREMEFLGLENINVNDECEEGTLLQLACERNLEAVVTYLLQNQVNVHKLATKNEKCPLEIAAEKGYHKIFKLLINRYTELPENILTLLLKHIGNIKTENIDYDECLKILLDEKRNIPVNAFSDTCNNTPLHYATGFADSDITLKLLQRGASLGNKNDFGFLPIEDIDPKTLGEHFDSCVTVKDRPRFDKQSIVVTFDYKTLIPTSSCNCTKDIESDSSLIECKCKNSAPVCETGVVYAMSKIPEMHHLLIHPLISSFLYIKWHRMRWFYRTNLLLFILFCISLITYVFLPDNGDVQAEYKYPVWFVLVVTYVILIFREFFQMVLSIKTYFRSLSNILEITMLCVCGYVVFNKSTKLLYRQYSSIAMVLIALEMMVLLGQHPRFSTNIVMLRTVAKNFFLFLSWYSILILAFVLCFYKLFNKSTDSVDIGNSTATETVDEEQDFFDEPDLTFIKIIVMLTGEFDASSLNFETVANKFIFLLFVFLIPIILFNLLNGLAVSDTQMIKSDAEIMGYIERINYIVYIENNILGNPIPKSLLCFFQQCFACCEMNTWKKYVVPKSLKEQISLFPHYLPEKKMEILLYHDGKIVMDKQRTGCFCLCKDLYVDTKTVKRVKRLLFEKNKKHENSQRIEELLERIKFQTDLIEQLRAALHQRHI